MHKLKIKICTSSYIKNIEIFILPKRKRNTTLQEQISVIQTSVHENQRSTSTHEDNITLIMQNVQCKFSMSEFITWISIFTPHAVTHIIFSLSIRMSKVPDDASAVLTVSNICALFNVSVSCISSIMSWDVRDVTRSFTICGGINYPHKNLVGTSYVIPASNSSNVLLRVRGKSLRANEAIGSFLCWAGVKAII